MHATDPTNASRTLLYDIHERRLDPELLEILGVPAAMLPEVRPSASVFGETAAHEGVPAGIPIAGIAGDQQAALFGQGCFEAGMAKNTYGTGAFLVLNTGTRRVISRRGLLTTLCCDAKGGAAYALEGSVFVAGAAVQWLRDELGLVRSASETGAHRRERARHRGRLRGAGLHRPRRALLGRRRARRDRRASRAGRAARSSCARRSRASPTRAAT